MKKGNVGDGVVFHAGFPNAAEDLPGGLSLDQLAIRHRASTFLWRLDELGIPELHWKGGAIVVVDRARQARSGQLVVAVVDEDFVVRQLKGKQLLRPDGTTETSESVAVWGVVTHVLQDYVSP